eukprot:3224560-Pyramimonas_sp.AAC.1
MPSPHRYGSGSGEYEVDWDESNKGSETEGQAPGIPPDRTVTMTASPTQQPVDADIPDPSDSEASHSPPV